METQACQQILNATFYGDRQTDRERKNKKEEQRGN